MQILTEGGNCAKNNNFEAGFAGNNQSTNLISFEMEYDEVTKQLMQRCIDSGYKPEQIARYALKSYLNELMNS